MQSEWMITAADAARSLAGAYGSEKRAIMRRHHLAGGPSPQNLQRMLVARDYVIRHAKAAGVSPSEVVASYAAVEALSRISSLDPAEAAERSRDVLLGHTSSRAIRAVLADLRKAQRAVRHSDLPDDWRVYCDETVGAYYGVKIKAFSPSTKAHTARGRWLGVDIEIELLNGEWVAVFLSPWCRFSSSAGQPVDRLWPRVLCALAYYHKVDFIFYDDEEATAIDALVKEGKWGAKKVHLYPPAPWDIALDDA